MYGVLRSTPIPRLPHIRGLRWVEFWAKTYRPGSGFDMFRAGARYLFSAHAGLYFVVPNRNLPYTIGNICNRDLEDWLRKIVPPPLRFEHIAKKGEIMSTSEPMKN